MSENINETAHAHVRTYVRMYVCTYVQARVRVRSCQERTCTAQTAPAPAVFDGEYGPLSVLTDT